MDNLDIELLDTLDLIDYTLSTEFLMKWKYKYGERLIKLFQLKLLNSFKDQKPLKIDTLVRFLVNHSGFNKELVNEFFIDIDYEIFQPIISGRLQQAINGLK